MITRFGTFTFDPERRQVFRQDGTALHLTPKAFDLLGILLEAAPSVVRKADLHERLWPQTFVSDATLAGLVKELRRAFRHTHSAKLLRTCYGVGYAFCGTVDTTNGRAKTGASSSLVVLPFTNLSGDAKNDHVSDALAEELISALMHIPGIRITSRTSAFQFRGAVNLNRIRSEVHADLAIEGSVQQAGKKLRLTVRLVNVADGYSLWSARYEGETADVFRLHDEIAGCVAKALRTVLTEARHLSERRDGVNMDAFELCLRARHNWHQRTPENLQTSIAQFETAIRLDPHCALGYAGLADSYSILAFYGYLPREDARIAANRAAKRALQLGPEFAESHYARALYTMWLASEWPQAERSFRKALEIQPDFAPAHTHYSALLAVRQRYAEARDHLAEASAVDPLSPAVYGTGALCMFTSLQYGEAERFGKRALELYPDFAVALYALGLTYCRTKRFDRACDAFERLLSLSNGAPYFQAWAAMAHASAGNRNTALALATEMANKHPSQSIHPLTHVLIGIALNDPGAAADALGAYTAQDGSGFQLGHILPFFTRRMLNSDMLRQLKRMHLEPAAGIESRPIARIR